jgi:hypothetical protein
LILNGIGANTAIFSVIDAPNPQTHFYDGLQSLYLETSASPAHLTKRGV